ncbi:SMI1 / KNR4 family protein [Symmachiella dynata]|uniref:SMI1/KNR4 family protein n=1 Tax=Symmachiella dynata TaxID=2527995 RepID=UPI0011899AE0|nr:SMI1/KNR4 family protein [Symmachiella dynata]QDT46829.1 SMI1 / KNR4 family protein [Symmachiella dynata]
MSVRINKSGSASETDVAALEAFLGVELPSEYKIFLDEYDGAIPEPNVFSIGNTNNSGVNEFIPAQKILIELKGIIDEIPPLAFPFAWAEGGNDMVIDMGKDGAVLFWDHETAEVTKIANDFNEFLSLLLRFNIDDVKLDPGQVTNSWIDPDFLKELGLDDS